MSRPRRSERRWRNAGGDHLPPQCDCRDCRKRAKRGECKRKPVWQRREKDAMEVQ